MASMAAWQRQTSRRSAAAPTPHLRGRPGGPEGPVRQGDQLARETSWRAWQAGQGLRLLRAGPPDTGEAGWRWLPVTCQAAGWHWRVGGQAASGQASRQACPPTRRCQPGLAQGVGCLLAACSARVPAGGGPQPCFVQHSCSRKMRLSVQISASVVPGWLPPLLDSARNHAVLARQGRAQLCTLGSWRPPRLRKPCGAS